MIYDKQCISVTEVFVKLQQISVRVQISKVISFSDARGVRTPYSLCITAVVFKITMISTVLVKQDINY